MVIGEIFSRQVEKNGSAGSRQDDVEPRGGGSSIFDMVDIRNIDFDPHLHATSDGDIIHKVADMAQELGVSIAVADHIRQVKDDVVYYKDDDQAYRNTDFSGENEIWLADNMDILQEIIDEERRDRGSGEEWGLEGTISALEANADAEGFELDETGLEEAALDFIETENQRNSSVNLVLSAEQDYETWNEEIITDFMREQDLPFWVLSTHYIPLERWDRPRYFRHNDFENLSEEELREAAENYFEQYEDKIRFGSQKEEELGTTVIHSHPDGIIRNDHLRPYVTEEDLDSVLDLAEEYDAVVEINGRIIRKLKAKYVDEDSFYSPEDAEWFAGKVLERAERGDLEFTVASDAHSTWEMFEQYAILDGILEEYGAEPLDYQNLLERGPGQEQFRDSVRAASSL